ncbi:zinc finger CCCH domain-containing protein 11A [Gadus macrocephalus]|uniref:zinc finger CCCH domain-containing protein 11A n=1 Tax=Gadus macrocephalus TaxID=80720 RepID=UPI0028CBB2BA|nr:zinc finger CCCH domain-containing protein 11A [Gadus macrocephalus]XP_059917989.1 zinc finger CCCH domain-containing protein 11A [Gadus macrocephalus]XP_059917997.1 zinc finger CCCH domain-containing protein 11A [Gadus macrocephalus]XP_059918005.1 zinc finger CCCH domain-containing protein 11A [Gadus macrocephalus]
MTNHGDDCYFYYYSTCTKGDSCPFRHCEAAMGNETVCNLWQEGRCFRMVCKFRHMEIQKNRKEIACYWENQPAGCQKTHCVFYHEKQRLIDGVVVPPSRGPKAEEPQHEEPAPPPTPLPAASNPQLRGVLKAEAQETVPSPTHPPVVINPADDDEDEDDQFSEEGEDGKYCPDGNRLTSPRKLSGASNQILNFGVSTLEEIRLRKALKASMKRAGYPVQGPDGAQLKSHRANRENHRFHDHPVGFQAREDPVYCGETERNDISDRLGKTMLNKDGVVLEQPPRKRSLADRLGRVVGDEEQTGQHPRNGLKPIRERLGFQADAEAPVWPVKEPESVLVPSEATQQIRIKTLEEIRQEKASKAQNKRERLPASALGSNAARTTSTKSPRVARRSVTVKDGSPVQTKTVSSVHANKKPEEEQLEPDRAPSPGRASPASQRPSAKARGPPSPPGADLRVKTLEEIRQEKAARLQAQQARGAEDTKSPIADAGEDPAKKPGLPCLNKAQVPSAVESSTPSGGTQTKKNPEAKEKPVASTTSSAEVNTASRNGVKVKTFEEIMREKRLRKQELEEQASSSPCPSPGSTDPEPPQKPSPVPAVKKTLPIKSHDAPAATATPPSAVKSSEGLCTTQSPPVRKRIALKSKAVSPSVPSPSTAAPTSPPQPPLTDAAPQSPHHVSNTAATGQGLNSCSTLTHVKQTKRMASQHKTPGQSAEIKVRPKLNVKPSVMKHATQVRPGHKRKLAVRSAVAEVKPLNSASTGAEEQLQEPQCKQRAISPTKGESQPRPAAPQSPGLSSSLAKEELQTVPIFHHPPLQDLPPSPVTKADRAADAAAMESCTIPQSPVMKTLTQVKPRRTSLVASRVSNVSSSSAVDDFDELMNEFTDDHLGEDMDPGMGEDDLLQELSEMIDS